MLELDACTGVGIDGGQDAIGGRSNDRTIHNLHILILESSVRTGVQDEPSDGMARISV